MLTTKCIHLPGDWDGRGHDSVGVYYASSGTVALRLGLGQDAANISYLFGPPNNEWWPVAADFAGGGNASIGLFDPVRIQQQGTDLLRQC